MRVAVRRFRSVLSALKSMLPREHHRWASDELKWLTHALGPARNWDIFADSLLHPLTEALSLEHLVGAVERRRRAVFDDAKQAILSERYTKSTLLLFRWFAGRGWREQPVTEHAALLLASVADVVPELIERCYRRARKRSKRFRKQTPAQRHRLRIALKKLRYTVEFLESLFDENRVRAFVNRLKLLQDLLGQANDLRVAYDLLDEIPEKDDPNIRRIDRAGGIVLGWHEHGLADREPKLRQNVRRFRNLKRFWRPSIEDGAFWKARSARRRAW